MTTAMQITEIDEIAQHIDEAKEMANFLPDVSTEEGYDKSKRVSLDIGKFLTGLEKVRKDKKSYFLNGGKEVDRQAKDIAAKLEQAQLPHKAAYKKFDDEQKQREEKRKEEHQFRLNDIEMFSVIYAESNSDVLQEAIQKLSSLSTDGMDEFEARAKTAKAESMVALTGMLEKVVKQEQDAAELARLQKEEADRKQAEREENIRKEASEKAEAIAKKAEEDKKAAEAVAKKADEDRIAAEKREEQLAIKHAEDKKTAEENAAKDADIAAENARKEEVARQEAEKIAEQEATAKREANQKHIGNIRSEAKDGLIALGLDEAKAKEIVLAIHSGKIKNVKISY